MKGDPLKATLLSVKIIPNVNPEMAASLGLRPDQRSIGMVTADSDDVTYTGLDEATKKADVEVVYAKSFYAGGGERQHQARRRDNRNHRRAQPGRGANGSTPSRTSCRTTRGSYLRTTTTRSRTTLTAYRAQAATCPRWPGSTRGRDSLPHRAAARGDVRAGRGPQGRRREAGILLRAPVRDELRRRTVDRLAVRVQGRVRRVRAGSDLRSGESGSVLEPLDPIMQGREACGRAVRAVRLFHGEQGSWNDRGPRNARRG